MNRFEITFTAIMATIIIHLTVAVIFMSVKISALQREIAAEIILAVEEELDPEIEKALELAKKEQMLNLSPEEMVNIIKNIADRPLDIDPKEYEEMVKEEMIKSGLLDEKKFIDDNKTAEEDAGMEEIALPEEKVDPKITEKTEKPEEKGTFRGPTRIYYDLANRHHVYLPVPIYKCEGAGQITLAIVVDRSGTVLRAEPASKRSTTKDPCLTETAIEHAFKTRFNSDQSAPEKQGGFLTFVFVSQN